MVNYVWNYLPAVRSALKNYTNWVPSGNQQQLNHLPPFRVPPKCTAIMISLFGVCTPSIFPQFGLYHIITLSNMEIVKKKTDIWPLALTNPPPHPSTLRSAFRDFFWLCVWPKIMNICFQKQILHKKKEIFIQLLESGRPLQMVICKRPKGMKKCIFETLYNDFKCVLGIKE